MMLLPDIELENVLPVLENGVKPILNSTFGLLTFPFTESITLLFLLPEIKMTNVRKAYLFGVLISGTILTILTTLSILVLSPEITINSIFPSYDLAQKIDIGGYHTRIEAIIGINWIISIFFATAVCFYVTVKGMAQLMNVKRYQMLTIPISMLAIVFIDISVPNPAYYINFTSKTWPFYSLSFGFLFPFLLWGAGLLKNRKP